MDWLIFGRSVRSAFYQSAYAILQCCYDIGNGSASQFTVAHWNRNEITLSKLECDLISRSWMTPRSPHLPLNQSLANKFCLAEFLDAGTSNPSLIFTKLGIGLLPNTNFEFISLTDFTHSFVLMRTVNMFKFFHLHRMVKPAPVHNWTI